jgi:hypothetical protein
VNRNVTTPEGAAAAGADTPAECHNRYAATLHIAGIGALGIEKPETEGVRDLGDRGLGADAVARLVQRR